MYIGQTNNIQRRWRGEGIEYVGCSYFYSAIQKYGWDNFEHSILEENLTEDEANQKEMYYIQYYNNTNPEYGYNLRSGGLHSRMSETSKQILSKKAKERGLWKGNKNPRHLHPLMGQRMDDMANQLAKKQGIK